MTSPILFPSRSSSYRLGRAKRSGGIYICVPGQVGSISGGAALTSGRDYYSPWYTRTPIVILTLYAEVTTASGTNFRMGLYAANRDWQPIGPPLADSGNLSSASTGVRTYTPSTPIYLPPGRYLSVTNTDGASLSLREVRGVMNQPIPGVMGSNSLVGIFYVTRAYGAFPTPGTEWTTKVSGSTPMGNRVFYEILG